MEISEAQSQVQQARTQLQTARTQAEEEEQRLQETKAKLPDVTSQMALRRRFAGLEGREQRRKISEASGRVDVALGEVAQFKEQVAEEEAKVQQAQTEIDTYNRNVQAYEEAKRIVEENRAIGYLVNGEDELVKDYIGKILGTKNITLLQQAEVQQKQLNQSLESGILPPTIQSKVDVLQKKGMSYEGSLNALGIKTAIQTSMLDLPRTDRIITGSLSPALESGYKNLNNEQFFNKDGNTNVSTGGNILVRGLSSLFNPIRNNVIGGIGDFKKAKEIYNAPSGGFISAEQTTGTIQLIRPLSFEEKKTYKQAEIRDKAIMAVPAQYLGTFFNKQLPESAVESIGQDNFVKGIISFFNPRTQYQIAKYDVQYREDVRLLNQQNKPLYNAEQQFKEGKITQEEYNTQIQKVIQRPDYEEASFRVENIGGTAMQRLANTKDISETKKFVLSTSVGVVQTIPYFIAPTRAILGIEMIREGDEAMQYAETKGGKMMAAGTMGMGVLLTYSGLRGVIGGTNNPLQLSPKKYKVLKYINMGLGTAATGRFGYADYKSTLEQTGSVSVALGKAIGTSGTILVGTYAPVIKKKVIGEIKTIEKEYIIKKPTAPRQQSIIEEQFGQTRTSSINKKGESVIEETKGLFAKDTIVKEGKQTKVILKGGLLNLLKGTKKTTIYSGSYNKDPVGYNRAINLLRISGYNKLQAKSIIKETKAKNVDITFVGKSVVRSTEGGKPEIEIIGIKRVIPNRVRLGNYETTAGKIKSSAIASSGTEVKSTDKETLYNFLTSEAKVKGNKILMEVSKDITVSKKIGGKSVGVRDVEKYRTDEVSQNLFSKTPSKSYGDVYLIKGEPQFKISIDDASVDSMRIVAPGGSNLPRPTLTDSADVGNVLASSVGKILGTPTATVKTNSITNLIKTDASSSKVLPFVSAQEQESFTYQQPQEQESQGRLSITGNVIREEPKQEQKVTTDYGLSEDLGTIEGTELKESAGLKYRVGSGEKSKSNLVVKTGVALRVSPAMRTSPSTQLELISSLKTSKNTQPKLKPKKTPGERIRFSDTLIKRLAKRAETSPEFFEAVVTKMGKEVSLGKRRSQEEAESLLKKELKGTLRAGGGILRGTEKIKASQLKLFGGREFKVSKVNPYKVVQRREFRLGTIPERREIQYFKKTKGAKLI